MRKLLIVPFVVCVVLLGSLSVGAASEPSVEKLLQSMTLEQKVGQLFIIRPDALDTSLTPDEINDSKAAGVKELTPDMKLTLKRYPAGGFVLFRKNIASPKQLKHFTADLKAACGLALPAGDVPAIMAIDEEGGRIARIANHKNFDVTKFESMEAIGNTRNPRKAREAAESIGKYLVEYGFTMDFAPVADVNTNPENIVIGDRAFGSDPGLVSKMVGAYLDGLYKHGVAGSLKHFPGHGDTKDDTHSGSVVVEKTWEELLKAEIIPFRENLARADSVMVAHIELPNVTGDNLPATLSKKLIMNKLRNELEYGGVVITDAMMMHAIIDRYTSDEAAVLALEAGNDVILMPWDYREAFDGVLQAVRSGIISEARLDESVRRILRLKTGG